MHVICCGVPLILSITSLAALLGVSGGGIIDHVWFEQYELGLMIMSGVVLLCAVVAHYVSKRINCLEDGVCVHEPCEPKKNMAGRVLLVSSAIYAMNLMLFVAH